MTGNFPESLTIKISTEMLDELNILAKADDRSVSYIVRKLLKDQINTLRMGGAFPSLSEPPPPKKTKKNKKN